MRRTAVIEAGVPGRRRGFLFTASVKGLITASAMRRCNPRNSASVCRLVVTWRSELWDKPAGFECFMVNLLKRGDAVIPFQECGRPTRALDGAGVEFPDRVNHGMIMGVENVFPIPRMAGDVDLGDAFRRDVVQIVKRIKVVVEGRNV